MPRKKSINDLTNQYFRIMDNSPANSPREQRAWGAFQRYTDNIFRTKSASNPSNWDTPERLAARNSRQYSQRTYMGLAAG